MIAFSSKARTRSLLFLLGGAASLGQAPFSMWIVSIGALFTLYVIQLDATEVEIGPFQRGWIFGFGYFIGAINWILEPFLIDASRHGWMAPFALVFVAGGLSLFWGLGVKLCQLLGNNSFSLAFGLGSTELVRGYILTGFPWALVGYIWTDTPVAQLASLVGVYGLTILTFILIALLFEIFVKYGVYLTAVLGCCLLVIGWSWGTYRGMESKAPEATNVVRLVQPNAPQKEKWHPEHSLKFFERMLDYSSAEPKPDIIIWPETALPIPVEYAAELFDLIRVATKKSEVLLGALRFNDEQYFNSIIYLDQNQNVITVYDKHHLVPFGEYLPFEPYLKNLGVNFVSELFGLGFGVGNGPAIFVTEELGSVLPLICYEVVFPQNTRVSGERANVLVQITNDAWFGKNSGPQQHLNKAQMRSIEQGLALIRVANTGISGVIDPYGRLIASIALNEAGYLDTKIPPAIKPPLYTLIGEWASLILLCFLMGMALLKRSQTLRVDLKTK